MFVSPGSLPFFLGIFFNKSSECVLQCVIVVNPAWSLRKFLRKLYGAVGFTAWAPMVAGKTAKVPDQTNKQTDKQTIFTENFKWLITRLCNWVFLECFRRFIFGSMYYHTSNLRNAQKIFICLSYSVNTHFGCGI